MYNEYDVETPNRKNINITYIIIAIVVIIGIFILIKIISNNSGNVYTKTEKELISKAQEYIEANNINTNNEIFISVTKLDIKIPDTCYVTSGVIVNNDEYTPYLACSEYESKVIDNQNNKVVLKGKTINVIPKGIEYNDAGYYENGKVKIAGKYEDEEGVYNIYYIPEDGTKVSIRKVIVVDNEKIKYLYPTIKLKGEKEIKITKGEKYQEQGVEVFDVTDKQIENKIIKTGTIDTNNVGEYEILYEVINEKGFRASTKRKVIVVDNETDVYTQYTLYPKELTSDVVTINFVAYGDEYKETILPDGTKTNDRKIIYQVKENGTYKFIVYDILGRSIEKDIIIDNINTTPLEIDCTAKVYSDYVEIDVTKPENIIVTKYKYIINNKESEYTAKNKYTYKVNTVSTVQTEAQDITGRKATTTCKIVQQDPSIGNKNITYLNRGTTSSTEYVVPKTKNGIYNLEKTTCLRISQAKRTDPVCNERCDSYALYTGYYALYGDLNSMNVDDACNWRYPKRVLIWHKTFPTTMKQLLQIVYDEINKGHTVVARVTGGADQKSKESRHFVVIVGYRRQKYYAKDLKEEDLLIINPSHGCFDSLSLTQPNRHALNDIGGSYYIFVLK